MVELRSTDSGWRIPDSVRSTVFDGQPSFLGRSAPIEHVGRTRAAPEKSALKVAINRKMVESP